MLWINVMLGLDESRGVKRRASDDAISQFPDFLPLYKAAMRALMPRWGGSYEQVNNLIEDAASSRDSAVGARMYSRLYWAYALLEGDDVDIFTDGMANWPRMSEGFDLLLKQYPDSDYLMNGYAYMACRAGDSDKYPIQGRTGTLRFTGWKNYRVLDRRSLERRSFDTDRAGGAL